MKKLFTFLLIALTAFGVANAQSGYNRVGISYDNTQVSAGGDLKGEMENFKLNGFGLNYIHGFSVSRSLPMFVEVGANVDFGFGNAFEEKYDGVSAKMKIQDINLQVPVNFAYRFNVVEDFTIAPYVGINFKLHLLTRGRIEAKEDGIKVESDWSNFFSKDDMGDDDTFNRFQMGWHIGATFQYTKFSFGVQYGTDFIPFYSYSEKGYKEKINTANLKLTLGYNF